MPREVPSQKEETFPTKDHLFPSNQIMPQGSHTIFIPDVQEHDGNIRILPCFQEEMMVQEDPIKLEKLMAWREEKKQIKIGCQLYSRLT